MSLLSISVSKEDEAKSQKKLEKYAKRLMIMHLQKDLEYLSGIGEDRVASLKRRIERRSKIFVFPKHHPGLKLIPEEHYSKYENNKEYVFQISFYCTLDYDFDTTLKHPIDKIWNYRWADVSLKHNGVVEDVRADDEIEFVTFDLLTYISDCAKFDDRYEMRLYGEDPGITDEGTILLYTEDIVPDAIIYIPK